MSNLPLLAGYAGGGDLVTMLRSLGPGVLRFGGVSADSAVGWSEQGAPLPAWASASVDAADFRELALLAARSGWHVLLTLGLGHYEPEAAAQEAAAAKAALGEWLEGVEMGNEPNAYALHGLRSQPWTVVQYDAQVAAYRSAIEAAVPGVALAGPDTSGSSAFESWGLGEVVNQRPALLTGHHYALGCEEDPAPSIAHLLSPKTHQLEEISLHRYVAVAQESETPFRMDETNNVSCGGVAGISNTFASALWAVGYLTQAISAGVAGVNLHGHPAECLGYSPICAPTPEDLATGTLDPQPEWYALLLIKALMGDRPLPTFTSSRARPNVLATALLARNGRLHFVIVDDDSPEARPLRVRLQVGAAYRAASVMSLTAPSPVSLGGVRLGGQTVAADGSWTPPSKLPVVSARGGMIEIPLAPSSAALVTVAPAPRAR